MPDFFINGQPVHAEPGQTVLQAALAAGHYIPYFCWHPDLSVAGTCRMCIVDVEGRRLPAASCTLKAEEGMVVRTESEKLRRMQSNLLRMVLSENPAEPSPRN